MKCQQRGFYLTLGILNVLAVVLMSIAVGTNKWTEASVVRKIAISSGNSTKDASFVAGFKYIGLFRGCEEKKYAIYFEPRSRCFNALEEYGEVAKAELAYATLISCCLCIGFHVITIYISLYDELVRSASNLLQCVTPVTTMSFTVFLGSVSFGSYFYLYKEYLQVSLLNTSDRQDGFSTRDSSSLGYSFWMMITSSCLNIMTILMLIVGVLRSGKTTLSFGKRNTSENEPTRSKDGPVMMMY